MSGDWERLAEFAAKRRADLQLSQAKVAHRGNFSTDRVQAIEGARRDGYRLSTLRALERALEWEEGSVERILAGGDPVPRGGTRRRPSAPRDGARDPREELRADAGRVLATIEEALSSGQVEEVVEDVEELEYGLRKLLRRGWRMIGKQEAEDRRDED